MHINWIGKSSELKLHCFCLIDAYSMPKDICSVKENAQMDIVNARKTISVAIANVHVIVVARTEILNFGTEINSLIQYFYSSEINGLPI